MNEKYLPASLEAMAGHVKPAPGQTFLLNEFPERYRTEYRLPFVLAVYYDLLQELAEHTAGLNENRRVMDNCRVAMLRQLRHKLAQHEVKYINTQPAFLTNYQQSITLACAKG